MEPNKILHADLLDILFDGRNKSYGAYDLRKTYNKRMTMALAGAAALLLVVFVGNVLANSMKKNNGPIVMNVKDLQLDKVKPVEPLVETPPPAPPPKQEPPRVEIRRFNTPQIIPDDQVKDDEKPPAMDELEDTKIGNINQEGIKDDGIVAPPESDGGKGVVVAPVREETAVDSVFTKVELESDYPGGAGAWARYLNKNLRYPQDAADNEIQGMIVVQFIVDREGAVSDVEAISGPSELRDEAVRVIKKSGKWTPAIQNGRQVKSYKKQPITFKLLNE
ncbi:energy transducer TonB [Flavihumibacter solisilvae]|uniref:Energy transducer TonB n=1 Tax=Flavihumibacter solisilvae TaxID=1349421 RepID=A0A0C1LKL4_9BACT|nr:energy transducer TonB [Flavihumibacter solisilvae]KIC95913.1 energy transducer TonB [Flavihumibacter solisilvae]